MQIIIEGCDGTGKTTLARKLSVHFNLSYIHLSRKDPTDYIFYQNIFRKENVVFDRSYISEYIYPKYRHKKSNINFNDISYLLQNYNSLLIILTGPIEIIRARLLNRANEDNYVISNLANILYDYSNIGDLVNCMFIDITKYNNFDEMFNEIKEKVDAKLSKISKKSY